MSISAVISQHQLGANAKSIDDWFDCRQPFQGVSPRWAAFSDLKKKQTPLLKMMADLLPDFGYFKCINNAFAPVPNRWVSSPAT